MGEDLGIVGLDLSLTGTGVAGSDGECFTVGGPAKLGDSRLQLIVSAVETVLNGDLYIIEDLPIHARSSGKTGMVHGAVRKCLLDAGKRYVLITPASLKKFATGNGAAKKDKMAESLLHFFDLELADDNQVDAFWLRVLGFHLINKPLVSLPDNHLVALEKIHFEL